MILNIEIQTDVNGMSVIAAFDEDKECVAMGAARGLAEAYDEEFAEQLRRHVIKAGVAHG